MNNHDTKISFNSEKLSINAGLILIGKIDKNKVDRDPPRY